MNKHKEHCTCNAQCNGGGPTLAEQARIAGYNRGFRLIGSADTDRDRAANQQAELQQAIHGRSRKVA
jgi:hypothetical protein